MIEKEYTLELIDVEIKIFEQAQIDIDQKIEALLKKREEFEDDN